MEQVNTLQRQAWIDQYRGILFYFVILFHTFLSPVYLRWFFDFFFLPGFFFLSGYLFRPKGIRNNILGIVNSLLIPYFIFSLLLAFYFGVKVTCIDDYVRNFWSIFAYGHDQIWFIPCLIVVEFVATITLNVINDIKVIISLSSLLFLTSFILTNAEPHHLIWNVDTAIYATFFFIVGNLLRNRVKFPSKVVSLLLFCFYVLLTETLGFYNYIGTNNIDMHMNIIGNPFVYMNMGIFGSISLFFVCNHLKIMFFFEKLGQYTLFSFPFHSIFYYKVMGAINKLDLMPSSLGGGISRKVYSFAICYGSSDDYNMLCF